jgi:hypothetical protein
MNQTGEKPTISIWSNIGLLLFICVAYLIEYFFTPETVQKVPYERFFDKSPFIATIAAVLLALGLLAGAAVFVRQFWNRFVAEVFKIRSITLQEAIAIILVMTLLTK